MISMMFVAMYIPLVLIVALEDSPLSAAGFGAAIIAFAGLVYWALGRRATDIVLTRRSLHLFWRLFSGARHESFALATIVDAKLGRVGVYDAHRAVIINLRDGRSLRLELTRDSRWGVLPRYKVVANSSAHEFDPQIRNANHATAFVKAVNDERQRVPEERAK